jgi:D-aspartate ligase
LANALSEAVHEPVTAGVLTDLVPVPVSQTRPPALLTMANYNGTLAAVRALGRAGIRVVTADPSRLAVSAWSKFTSVHTQAPPVQHADRFVEWLMTFGAKHGRHVLLPTSDDTAWLYSLHREELSRYFDVGTSPYPIMSRLLNKRLLYQDAVEAGLSVPRTWFPLADADLEICLREARFPVMVKPLTQVMFPTQSKGFLVEHPRELRERYAEFSRLPYTSKLLELDPTAARPMVQEFYPEAATGIYNISAYVHAGRICGARGARKLLQQPRRLGTGVCFEEAAIVPDLAAGLQRLVANVGFSGVFEAEFIISTQQSVLIDFNPRFYNQMAFDIARGLPLPLLAYYEALGDERLLRDQIADTMRLTDRASGRVYVDLFSLRILLAGQTLSGKLSRDERDKWIQWHEQHRDRCTYAVIDADDRVPTWLNGLQLLVRHGRHPRNFVKTMILNRA